MKPYLISLILTFGFCNCIAQTKEAVFVNKDNLQNFISSKFKFPEKARKRGLQTVLILTFKVDKRGDKNSVHVAGNTGGIDTAVYLAFQALVDEPEFKWKPAVLKGKPTDRFVAIPIRILYEFGDEKLEGEFLKEESYQVGFHQIMNHLYSLKNNYQLLPTIILMHYGAMH